MDIRQLDVDEDARPACASFLDQMFSHSNMIIALRGVDGSVHRVSRRLHRLFHAVGVDPVGKTVLDILPLPMARRIARLDQQVLETGRQLQSEEDLLIGGIRRHYLTSTMPVGGTGGDFDALFTIAIDVTARSTSTIPWRRDDGGTRLPKLCGLSALRFRFSTYWADCHFA